MQLFFSKYPWDNPLQECVATFDPQLQDLFAQHPGSTKPSSAARIIQTAVTSDTLSCLAGVFIVEVTMFSVVFTNSLPNGHKEMFSGWKSSYYPSCNCNTNIEPLIVSASEHSFEIKYRYSEFLTNNCIMLETNKLKMTVMFSHS